MRNEQRSCILINDGSLSRETSQRRFISRARIERGSSQCANISKARHLTDISLVDVDTRKRNVDVQKATYN